MNATIKPLPVALFGDCDTCQFGCNQLNLVDSCVIAFVLGVMVPQSAPPPRREINAKRGVVETVQDPAPAPVFSASTVSGQIDVTGDEFKKLADSGYDYDAVKDIISENVPSIVFVEEAAKASKKGAK